MVRGGGDSGVAGSGASPAKVDEHTLTLAALGVQNEWFFLRLELHPFLRGRVALDTAHLLPIRKLVQIHAILDKVDDDRVESMAELETRLKNQPKR